MTISDQLFTNKLVAIRGALIETRIGFLTGFKVAEPETGDYYRDRYYEFQDAKGNVSKVSSLTNLCEPKLPHYAYIDLPTTKEEKEFEEQCLKNSTKLTIV